ncbi:hypothetical protein DUI87_31060 [Hirundo rustica rustica]|uniref:inositol-polyphosphate 5-phosphatase n=1 Tax=Hirundo rustica rustica TaxID=333673 RepID=A0A3M0IX48_HIRRU|nr:hypothetical protein DUI87_31060 [Hirundo rustica rustica]
MAGKAAAAGAGVLLVTANVGSLFDDAAAIIVVSLKCVNRRLSPRVDEDRMVSARQRETSLITSQMDWVGRDPKDYFVLPICHGQGHLPPDQGAPGATGLGDLALALKLHSHKPENLQKNWLREFYQVVHAHKPHFMALHCQEFGGKNYEASMSHVDKFVKELLSSDAMKDYNRARVYLDENYKSQEHFTALGSFYFLHESLKNIYQFDFKAKKYKKVTGKEIYSDTLESTPMLEKEKFPQDYFPECKWSRKGFIRTRWCITDCAFDLVNIHLFHDASNLIAWETSPSVYSGIRHKALGYVLDRIIDQRFEKVSYFVFGDFNFRLDAKAVVELKPPYPNCDYLKYLDRESPSDSPQTCACHRASPALSALTQALDLVLLSLKISIDISINFKKVREHTLNCLAPWNKHLQQGTFVSFMVLALKFWSTETLCAKATMQTIRAADTNEVVKLIFRESDNDRKVMLQLEKKLFDYFNQDVFRDNNGTALLEFDRELSVFKDRLYELDISFPPSYPYSEDSSQGRQYMNTRCPAWCDRILMSHSAKELILKSENDEKIVIYDHIGPNVCMGDHKNTTEFMDCVMALD